MFVILQADKKSTAQNTGDNRSIRSISGSKFRSKTGCLTCRKRKRKCDETHPICNFCEARAIECHFPLDTQMKVQKPRSFKFPEMIKLPESANNITKRLEFVKETGTDEQISKPQTTTQLALNSVIPSDLEAEIFRDIEFNIPASPSSFASLYLNEEGLSYFDFYRSNVSNMVALTNGLMNYLGKFFNSLAMNEESFLYALTSWGALFSGKPEAVQLYLKKAIKTFKQHFKSQSFNDLYFKISFGTVLFGFFACIGEANRWKYIHDDCCQMLKLYGGLYEFAKYYGFSHESRFIISNICYSDIMSTNSHKFGLRFSASEYNSAFNCPEYLETELSYGIDTLQGAHQSIYLTLGALIGGKLEINNLLKQLNDCKDQDKYMEIKDKISDFYSNEALSLQQAIDASHPNYNLLSLILDESEYNLHIKVFELYQTTCRIYYRLFIERIPPISMVYLPLVKQIYELCDILIETRFCIILCLPLLMCGSCCVGQFDKSQVVAKINEVKKVTPVRNMGWNATILKSLWQLNENGTKVIDWADITNESDWYINLC